MNKNISVLVAGAGAVGAYFSGRLSLAGAEVSLILRSDYDAVKEKGFDIKSIQGDFNFKPAAVLKKASEFKGKPDVIIVALKALPEINVRKIIEDAVHENTVILLIQNGIDMEKHIKKAFPKNELLSAVANIGVTRIAPGKIIHKGSGNLKIGLYPEGSSETAMKIGKMFTAAGVKCDLTENIRKTRWEKLVWNAAFNPISVICKADTSRIMKNCKSAELAENIMAEVCKAADADNCPLSPSIVSEQLKYTRNYPPYKTSMLVDFENGRPLETDAIIGNILSIAGKNNIQLPCIATIYALIKLLCSN
jgi:2-dehydropantoate 2-reductase